MKQVRKAVIAAAGFGTRFLPQTKAMPKEMLPLIDKPIIQYVVEELVEAGIQDVIIVGSSNKRSIEDHFDVPNEDLLANLRAGGEKKKPYIEELDRLSNLANFAYVRQKGPYGNATPLLCAKPLINSGEPFVYAFADDFIVSAPNRTTQMIEAHLKYGGSGVFACKNATKDSDYDKYGFAAGEKVDDGVLKMTKIVEKPGKDNAPSTLASVSSYIFTDEIFKYIENELAAYDGSDELKLQPAVQQMIEAGHSFYACEIKNSTYYDTGDKLEYLKTLVDFGLKDEKLGADFAAYLNERLK